MAAEPTPPVKAMLPHPALVFVQSVGLLLLYVGASSVLGLLTPVFISPNGVAVYPYVWGLSINGDFVFVVGSVAVALLLTTGSRLMSRTWLVLWMPLAYLLTFAVYSVADSLTSPDGSCGASCAAGQVLAFGQPGMIFASLALALWGRRRVVTQRAATDRVT